MPPSKKDFKTHDAEMLEGCRLIARGSLQEMRLWLIKNVGAQPIADAQRADLSIRIAEALIAKLEGHKLCNTEVN